MKKTYCKKCGHYWIASFRLLDNLMNDYCDASKKYGRIIHIGDSPKRKGYSFREVWSNDKLYELNKDNNCPYYKRKIIFSNSTWKVFAIVFTPMILILFLLLLLT